VWTWWVLGGVLVVAFLAGFFWNRGQSETEQATVHRPTSTAGRNGGAIVGDANAPVTITEYGDFQCPVCAALHQAWGPTLDQLIQQGKVKFEFVGLGYLDGDGTESTRSAAAALCAADAGKFVEYYDVLYNQQSPVERSGFLTTTSCSSSGPTSASPTRRSRSACATAVTTAGCAGPAMSRPGRASRGHRPCS